MKLFEQYFRVVLFNMLYKVLLGFESVGKILKCDHQVRAIEQYFTVVAFIVLSASWFQLGSWLLKL